MSDKDKKLIDPLIYDEDKKPDILIPDSAVNSTFINPKSGLIEPMEFTDKPKSNEEKIYIILYKIFNDSDLEDMYNDIYSVCIGRTEAYTDIKDKLESGLEVDIHRSKIITETLQTETNTGNKRYYLMPFTDCISVYSFCTAVKEFFSDDEFNIEDYNTGDIPDNPNDVFFPKQNFMTAEQQEYRKLLEASMERGKFINEMKSGIETHNI